MTSKTLETTTAIQPYIDRAVTILQKYNVLPKPEESQLVSLLEGLREVDEPRVLAIASTIKYMSSFNELVRDNTEGMEVADRYQSVNDDFNSVREDANTMVTQLADGRIDLKEKAQNLWMKIRRGTIPQRFDRIKGTYLEVAKDVKNQLEKEQEIMTAYSEFRLALKQTEIVAYEVKKTQEIRLEQAKQNYSVSQSALSQPITAENIDAEKARLELARAEAEMKFKQEDKNFQLIKDISEFFTTGYSVGDVLIKKLEQTHNIKDQGYKRLVTFFTTNEHIFTTMSAVYQSQKGLHELTQTTEAMKRGVNQGLEQIAKIGGTIEQEGIKAGYDSMFNPDSVKVLVDSIIEFQTNSVKWIAEYRANATENTEKIRQMVEEGGKKLHDIVMSQSQLPSPKA